MSDTPRPRLLRWLDRLWPGHPDTWRDVPARLRPTVVSTLRLTTAAVISYLLTLRFTEGPIDLTGALTALLVVQATNFSTLKMAAVRIGAVVLGVLIAVALTTWTGLTWWSLALAVSASLVTAKVLRLGPQALEAPISAMLILGVHGADIAVETRVLTTLIGAGVGVAFTLALPPPVPWRSAASAVARVGWGAGAALSQAADDMADAPVTRPRAESWVSAVDDVRGAVREAAWLVDTVGDARRLNVRAVGTTDREPPLRSGLTTLEQTAAAARALFLVVAREAPETDTPEDGYGDEVRRAFSVVLAEMAAAVRRFGLLVEAEVTGREGEAEHALDRSLDALREARAILTELMFVDARSEPQLWLLRGSVLTAVAHVLAQLDVQERARVRAALTPDRASRLRVPRRPGRQRGGPSS